MTKKKTGAGRPSKYETHIKPFFDQIKDAYKRGVDEKEIAKGLGIAVSTWCAAKNKYPEFSEILKRDEEDVKKILERLDNALMKCAEGFEYIEEKQIIRKDRNGERVAGLEKYKRIVPPNPTAIFGAYNRFDKDYKRDKAYYDLKKEEIELKKQMAEMNFPAFELEDLKNEQ